jgi:hypothetical protein
MATISELIIGIAEHNIAGPILGSLIPDPKLTEAGLAEAKSLHGRILPADTPIDIICSSPMRRTLQTTLALFGDVIITTPLPVALPVTQPVSPPPVTAATSSTSPAVATPAASSSPTATGDDSKDHKHAHHGHGHNHAHTDSHTPAAAVHGHTHARTVGIIPLLLISEAQEIHPIPCDTGSPISKLIQWFPTLSFTGLSPDWYHKRGINSPFHLTTRIAALQERLWYEVVVHGHRHIVLVGHHGIFLKMTGVEFKNCQCVRFVLRHGKLVHYPLAA